MPRIRLLHWKAAEAVRYLELLRAAGYTVEYEEELRPASLRAQPPNAFVIDLSRLPARGREVGIFLRQSPKTRHVPLIFCEGAADKAETIRALLPDAAFCSFTKLKGTLRKALANPVKEPVRPVAMMDRFASRSTAQKLGIAEASTVCVVDPPRDFLTVLGNLPPDVSFVEEPQQGAGVTLCFAHDLPSLQARMSELRSFARGTKLWFCWRKGRTAIDGLSDSSVRATGIALGLVDYKICSVNEVWSGMLFARKKIATNAHE